RCRAPSCARGVVSWCPNRAASHPSGRGPRDAWAHWAAGFAPIAVYAPVRNGLDCRMRPLGGRASRGGDRERAGERRAPDGLRRERGAGVPSLPLDRLTDERPVVGLVALLTEPHPGNDFVAHALHRASSRPTVAVIGSDSL